jgi:hypothetical protein
LKNHSESNNSDYSAFEVFAHDYDIPVGECEELGGYVNIAIPACMTHKFTIRIEGDITTNDVIVDWGDGTTSVVANNEYADIVEYNNEWKSIDLLMSHTYNENGKYIIKILGKDYYTFRHYIIYFIDPDTGVKYKLDDGKHNILCRVLENDLPIASHLNTCASMFRGSKHLLHVCINSTSNFLKSTIITAAFAQCSNLISCNGLSDLPLNCGIGPIFINCEKLEDTDIVIPPFVSNISEAFKNCHKLPINMDKLFIHPIYPFLTNCTLTFRNCKLLTGTVKPEFFWNNNFSRNISHSETFLGCLALDLTKVPTSWGGAGDDSILIEKSDKEKIVDLESRLQILEAYINSNPEVTENTLEFE